MLEDLIGWLSSGDGTYVYAGVLILLILGGIGFPVPEDLPLLFAGIAIAKEVVNSINVFFVCYAGVFIGDQIMYFMGRHFGHRLLKAGNKLPFVPRLTNKNIDKVREAWRRNKFMYLLFARHFFPIRTPSFLAAGVINVPYKEFLIADALATMLSVSIMLILGYLFGHYLSAKVTENLIEKLHYFIAIIVFLIFLTWLFNIKQHCKNLYRYCFSKKK